MNIPLFFHNLKIKHKLLLSFFIVPIVFILFVGVISFLSSTSALRKLSYDIIYQYQQNTVTDILKNMRRYEILASIIYRNTSIQRLISNNYMDPYLEYETVRNVLNPTLFTLLDVSESGINIQLIRYNDINSEIIPRNIENILDSVRLSEYYIDNNSRQFHIINYNRVRNLTWVRDSMGRLNGNVWTQVGQDRDYNYISLLHEITNTSSLNSEAIGLLRLTIPFDVIFNDEINSADNGFYMVFNNRHELLSGDTEIIDFSNNNENFLRSFSVSDDDEALLDDQKLILLKSKPFINEWYIIRNNI